MTVLFWDIDGTLLTTGKAGVPAWEEAVKEVIGRDFQLSKFRIAGLTDYQIAVRTFELLSVDVDDDTIRRMVRRYEELLPAALPLKKGHVLPNVREILELLAQRDDVRSYLLTGNTRGGARARDAAGCAGWVSPITSRRPAARPTRMSTCASRPTARSR